MISEKKEVREERLSRLLTLKFSFKNTFSIGFEKRVQPPGGDTLMFIYFNQNTTNRKDGNLVSEDLKK